MRLALSVSSSVLMFTAVAASAFGQATVEHALTTGAASLGASGMSGVGKSIGAVFDQLNRVLQNTGTPASPQAAGVSQATPPSVAQFQEMVVDGAVDVFRSKVLAEHRQRARREPALPRHVWGLLPVKNRFHYLPLCHPTNLTEAAASCDTR